MSWAKEQLAKRGLKWEDTSESSYTSYTGTSVSSSAFSIRSAHKSERRGSGITPQQPLKIKNQNRTSHKKKYRSDKMLTDMDIDITEPSIIEDQFDLFVETSHQEGAPYGNRYRRQGSIDLDHQSDDDHYLETLDSFESKGVVTFEDPSANLSVTHVAVKMAVGITELNLKNQPMISIPPINSKSSLNSETLSGCYFDVHSHIPSLSKEEFMEVISSVDSVGNGDEKGKRGASPFGAEPESDPIMKIQ